MLEWFGLCGCRVVIHAGVVRVMWVSGCDTCWSGSGCVGVGLSYMLEWFGLCGCWVLIYAGVVRVIITSVILTSIRLVWGISYSSKKRGVPSVLSCEDGAQPPYHKPLAPTLLIPYPPNPLPSHPLNPLSSNPLPL